MAKRLSRESIGPQKKKLLNAKGILVLEKYLSSHNNFAYKIISFITILIIPLLSPTTIFSIMHASNPLCHNKVLLQTSRCSQGQNQHSRPTVLQSLYHLHQSRILHQQGKTSNHFLQVSEQMQGVLLVYCNIPQHPSSSSFS